METAKRRLDATTQAFTDIDKRLDQALTLGQDCQEVYLAAVPKLRRQINQAFFEKLLTLTATLTPETTKPAAQPQDDESPQDNPPHATRQGLNERRLVDLEKAYSNPCDQAKRLQTLLELPRADGPRAAKRATKQAQKRLDGDEVAQVVAAHQAGAGVKELAKRFGIHRATVSDILRREGALRAPGIQPDDVPEVIRLYEDGWSLAQLGEKFDVSAGTVSRALRAEGVTIRRPGGQPPAGGLAAVS